MNASSTAVEPVVAVAKRILSARAAEVAPYARLYPLLLADMGEIMAEWDRKTDELPWSDTHAGGYLRGYRRCDAGYGTENGARPVDERQWR